jgi:hypothetical protein
MTNASATKRKLTTSGAFDSEEQKKAFLARFAAMFGMMATMEEELSEIMTPAEVGRHREIMREALVYTLDYQHEALGSGGGMQLGGKYSIHPLTMQHENASLGLMKKDTGGGSSLGDAIASECDCARDPRDQPDVSAENAGA